MGVLTVLMLVLTGLTSTAGLSAAAPTPEPSASDLAASDLADPVTVRLLSLSPEVVRPGDTLTVVAQIENTAATDITAPVARLSLATRYTNRTTFAAWEQQPTSAPLGVTVQNLPLPQTLAARTTTTVTFSVPADSLRLTGGVSGWGPRGIAVSVTGEGTTSSATTTLGALRTYLVWFPVADEDVTPVDVSVLVPVTGPAFDPLDPAGSATALAQATDKTGRLTGVVASTADFPAVGWAVDPAVVSPVTGADEPATTPSVTAWALRALQATTGREVFALPTFDQDWGAYADAGLVPPEREALPNTLSTWRTDLTWAAQTAPTKSLLRLAAAADAPLVVAAQGSLQPDPELTYTPTGLASLETSAGTVTALVPDPGLSAQLTAPGQTSPAAARQRMIAELAVVSRERPAEARSLLLTVPRSWAPTPELAQAQLGGIDNVPWARLSPVSTLLTSPVPEISRATASASTSDTGGLSRDALDSLAGLRSAVADFAQVVPDPAALTAPIDAATLAATAVTWRADPTGRQDAIDRVRAAAEDITGSISVASQSNFTLISSGSNLPIKVHNSLDQPATVTVSLSPDHPRLGAQAPVTIVVPAGSDATAMVAVSAVGRGNVTVTVQILNSDGTVIASPASISVKVRADWENRGTAIIAGLLVVLLGGGIWRTIHRGRSDRRASAAVVEQLEQLEQGEHGDVVEAADADKNGEPREHPHER